MTIAHHPHRFAPAWGALRRRSSKGMAMDTAEAPGQTRELGWVWFAIPALWLFVGIAGFVALSQWPQLFA